MSLSPLSRLFIRLNSFQATEDRLTDATVKLKTVISEEEPKSEGKINSSSGTTIASFVTSPFRLKGTDVLAINESYFSDFSSKDQTPFESSVVVRVEIWVQGLKNSELKDLQGFGRLCFTSLVVGKPHLGVDVSASLFLELGMLSIVNISVHSLFVGYTLPCQKLTNFGTNLPQKVASSDIFLKIISEETQNGDPKSLEDFRKAFIAPIGFYARRKIRFLEKLIEKSKSSIKGETCICYDQKNEDFLKSSLLKIEQVENERAFFPEKEESSEKSQSVICFNINDAVHQIESFSAICATLISHTEETLFKCYQHAYCFLRDEELVREITSVTRKTKDFSSDPKFFFKTSKAKTELKEKLLKSPLFDESDVPRLEIVQYQTSPTSFGVVEENLGKSKICLANLIERAKKMRSFKPLGWFIERSYVHDTKSTVFHLNSSKAAFTTSDTIPESHEPKKYEKIQFSEKNYEASERKSFRTRQLQISEKSKKSDENLQLQKVDFVPTTSFIGLNDIPITISMPLPSQAIIQSSNLPKSNRFSQKMIENSQIKTSVVFLVHGFHGSDFDMRHFQALWTHFGHRLHVKISTSNSRSKNISTLEMGKNFADEVINFLHLHPLVKNISFYGHSLGGIVIRAALPYLTSFSSMMRTIVTTGSPHLARRVSGFGILDFGFILVKDVTKSTALNELSLRDHINVRETAIFQLASEVGLNWFENVFLIGSPQDLMVSFESAHMELSDYMKRPEYSEMITQLQKRLEGRNVVKITVNMEREKNNLDWILGRRPHLEFIEHVGVTKHIAMRVLPFLHG